MTVESSSDTAQPGNDDLLEALYRTDRWLRKITKTMKNDLPEDEEGKEKLALQMKRARRQIRANKPLLGGGGGDEDLGDGDFGAGDEDDELAAPR